MQGVHEEETEVSWAGRDVMGREGCVRNEKKAERDGWCQRGREGVTWCQLAGRVVWCVRAEGAEGSRSCDIVDTAATRMRSLPIDYRTSGCSCPAPLGRSYLEHGTAFVNSLYKILPLCASWCASFLQS